MSYLFNLKYKSTNIPFSLPHYIFFEQFFKLCLNVSHTFELLNILQAFYSFRYFFATQFCNDNVATGKSWDFRVKSHLTNLQRTCLRTDRLSKRKVCAKNVSLSAKSYLVLALVYKFTFWKDFNS
jgi:hypothetical protein